MINHDWTSKQASEKIYEEESSLLFELRKV